MTVVPSPEGRKLVPQFTAYRGLLGGVCGAPLSFVGTLLKGFALTTIPDQCVVLEGLKNSPLFLFHQ